MGVDKTEFPLSAVDSIIAFKKALGKGLTLTADDFDSHHASYPLPLMKRVDALLLWQQLDALLSGTEQPKYLVFESMASTLDDIAQESEGASAGERAALRAIADNIRRHTEQSQDSPKSEIPTATPRMNTQIEGLRPSTPPERTQQASDGVKRRFPPERIKSLMDIAAKPEAGDNSVFVIELLDNLRQALGYDV